MKDNMIKNSALAEEGLRKINWVRKNMPILRLLEKDFEENQYFKGVRIALSIHLEAKTAVLALLFAAGGAEISVTGSNPLSTKDDVVAALDKAGLHVYAWHGASKEEYRAHINAAMDIKPQIVIDDGGDLVELLHEERKELVSGVLGACEETTTGVLRNKAREKAGKLSFPVVAVNDAWCKYLFDNRYGTGQSTLDAVMRTTNLVISGKSAVVLGYGWVGKGVAARLKGMGARVTVTEIDPVKALEAVMDGFEVKSMDEVSPYGEIFITATGNTGVITGEHFEKMKDGVILGNAGHFPVEIDLSALNRLAVHREEVRENLFGYMLPDGRWINVLGDGNIVNIACADGHPAEIMDMSFALQALSAKYLLENHQDLENRVRKVPDKIDVRVAELKLQSLGITIDSLRDDQKEYLEGF